MKAYLFVSSITILLVLMVGISELARGLEVNLGNIEISPVVAPVIYLMETEFNIPLINFNFNPFSWFNNWFGVTSYFVDNLKYLSVIPDKILIPLMLFLTMILIYSIIPTL